MMCSSAGTMPSEVTPAYIYESNIHLTNILTTLNEQRKCGLLCDISIIVQDTEFKAHKAILASCSSYFNRIITDPANVSHNIVLELSSISKLGMECLLEFAYTSKLAVTNANIDDVLSAAGELEFKNIEFSCLNLLRQRLNSGTSTPSFNSSEASTLCSKSTISRKGGPQMKQGRVSDCCVTNACTAKQEKSHSKPSPISSECPLAKVSLEPGRKDVSEKGLCPEYKYDSKSEMCEQMSQEQHQAIMKKILEKHGLEAATVDEKSMELGATETAAEVPPRATCPLRFQRFQKKSSCSRGSSEKKMCPSNYLSSSYNSDTDEAEEEMESSPCSISLPPCGKLRKQPAIKLPFTMDEITSMPRSDLHDMLTRDPNLTQEQICAIHEIRRRGKNRIAAQRCRKRKMECIQSLVAEIEMLRTEHAALMNERRDARDQAIKLSDKFKAKCEKFFKCDKKKCVKQKFCGNPANIPSQEDEAARETDQLSAQHFQEHARRAQELCARLKEAPTEDLPPCVPAAISDCSIWSRQCLSPSETETFAVCVTDDGDSGDAGNQFQPCSPSSSCSANTYAMSPSQRLSDFGNIHISPPSGHAETAPTTSCRPRTSVVLHTSAMDSQGSYTHNFPSLDTASRCTAMVQSPSQTKEVPCPGGAAKVHEVHNDVNMASEGSPQELVTHTGI